MNPIAGAILVVLMVVVLAGSRRAAVLAMMAGVLYLTQRQQVAVGGLNMFAVRFLELAAFIRVMARGEFSFARMRRPDQVLIILYVYTAVVYCLRSTEGFAYMIGNSVDALLCYFAFRGLIQEYEDFSSFLDSFIYLLAPYALLVVFESVTMRNPFAFEGGGMYDWVRNGRLRCVGSFRGPDLLGTLGAVFLPLYIAKACVKEKRKLAVAAIVCCVIIVWACNSGGPMSAAAAGVVGWMLWRIRGRMYLFRRGLVALIVLAAIFMKAPVWYLIAHVSSITGGDGWHRSYLIDVSYRHLSEWWLAGLPMADTMDWFPYALQTGADITNFFVTFGLNAGLVAIALFILMLKQTYSILGQALDAVRSTSEAVEEKELLLWGLGAMLGTHIVNWFGITYYDQSYVLWFMQMAAITSIAGNCIQNALIESPSGEFSPEETDQPEPVMQFEHESP